MEVDLESSTDFEEGVTRPELIILHDEIPERPSMQEKGVATVLCQVCVEEGRGPGCRYDI